MNKSTFEVTVFNTLSSVKIATSTNMGSPPPPPPPGHVCCTSFPSWFKNNIYIIISIKNLNHYVFINYNGGKKLTYIYTQRI